MVERRYLAPRAWVDGAWAEEVLLVAGPEGHWTQVEPQASAGSTRNAIRLAGAVLPGLVNAHSHAFQRAIAGLTERRGGAQDDFWSWRERMYQAALRITPAQLQAVATQLYAELLAGGYTHVCEFHYLHHDMDGRPYAEPLEMALALVRAAQATGIGLTLLPTLYMHSGFAVQRGGGGLRDQQRRFAGTPQQVLRMAESINALQLPHIHAGVALHSLRAVDPGALQEVAQASRKAGWPIHIHIAEQSQEVDDCVAHHGLRPIEWLLSNAPVDSHWNLVHATHTTHAELRGVRDTGASIVICPSTEANLGDGVFDFPTWAGLGGPWSIGSDSHVSRCAVDELRLLEYSQRFVLRRRNVAARAGGDSSSATALWEGALRGGTAAAGVASAGLAVGQRADFVVLDNAAPALAGVPSAFWLDALLFSTPQSAAAAVFVAGSERSVRAATHQPAMAAAMQALWS